MPVPPKAVRRPTITIALGRQRVGKTVLLNTLGQYYRSRGCPVQIWNADQQNQSHALTNFFSDGKTVTGVRLDDAKAWIEARFEELLMTGGDAILDVGGGATGFARLAAEIPLLEATEESGMLVVGMFVTGPEAADLDYLEQFDRSGSLPKSTAVIMNEALVSTERSASVAFEPIFHHKAVNRVLMNGGITTMFPTLTCMSKVAGLGISFVDAMNGGGASGQTPLGMFDRLRVNKWWSTEVPTFVGQLPQDWVPIEARSASTMAPVGKGEAPAKVAVAAE